jgi:hypothetical protein
MKLTDTQVNEVIATMKNRLKDELSSQKTAGAIGSWCDPQNIEDLVCDKDLWDELNALEAYMSPKQASRYTDEISLEIYKVVAREARKSNPLLAAAFDATKPTTSK